MNRGQGVYNVKVCSYANAFCVAVCCIVALHPTVKVAWSATVSCSDLLENDIKCVY